MADRQELRDEELVSLCQQGERQCFEILVRRYMEKAFHIAFNFTRDAETAKDFRKTRFCAPSRILNSLTAGQLFTPGFIVSW